MPWRPLIAHWVMCRSLNHSQCWGYAIWLAQLWSLTFSFWAQVERGKRKSASRTNTNNGYCHPLPLNRAPTRNSFWVLPMAKKKRHWKKISKNVPKVIIIKFHTTVFLKIHEKLVMGSSLGKTAGGQRREEDWLVTGHCVCCVCLSERVSVPLRYFFQTGKRNENL